MQGCGCGCGWGPTQPLLSGNEGQIKREHSSSCISGSFRGVIQGQYEDSNRARQRDRDKRARIVGETIESERGLCSGAAGMLY